MLALPRHVRSWADHTRSKISETFGIIVPMVAGMLCVVNVVSASLLGGHCSIPGQLLWLLILIGALLTPMFAVDIVLDAAVPMIDRAARGASARINVRREALIAYCRKQLQGNSDLPRISLCFDASAERRWRVLLVVVDRIKHIVRGRLGVPAVTLAPRLTPTPSLLSA